MKRHRSTSPSYLYPPDGIDVPEHKSKFQRIETASSKKFLPLWCSLGPGCAPPNDPTSFQTVEELETHYTQCHAYVCNADGCNCVFEREFYLNLHQTELHDPLVQIRKERGEAIYACLLPECPQKMQSPNQRKRHLINEHQFDERFFFAVIRFGIGDQIRAWGNGGEGVPIAPKSDHMKRFQDPLKTSGEFNYDGGRRIPNSSTHSSRASLQPLTDPGIEDLTRSMKNASLVPNSIQFGRAATKGTQECQPSYMRNASFGDIKMHSSLYNRQSAPSDSDGDMDEDEDEPQLGVRFAEEVAIRFLSPVDRRHGAGGSRRGRKRNADSGGKHGRAGGGRKEGVHSDDETRGRSRNFRDNRPVNHGGYRGRARGNRGGGGGRTSAERGFRGDGY